MNKQSLFLLQLLIGIGLSIQYSVASFTPHHEPIVYESSPKPNIYFVIDDSGSMKYNLKGQRIIGNLNKPSRTEVLVPILKEVADSFNQNAYIGLSYLGNGKDKHSRRHPNMPNKTVLQYLAEDIPEAKNIVIASRVYYTNIMPVSDLSVDNNKEKFHALVDKYSDKNQYNLSSPGFVAGNTPLGPALYSASLYLRNKDLYLGESGIFKKQLYYRPYNLQYRCQDSYVLLLSDGQENVFTVPYRAPGDTPPVVANLANMATFAHSLDLRDDAIKKFGPNDQANMPWKGPGSKKLPIYMYVIGFALNGTGASGSGLIPDSDGLKGYMKELNKAAKLAGGRAFEANDSEALQNAFDMIFRDIIKTKSGASSFTDQFDLTKNAIYYQSFYNPDRWTGEIRAYTYNTAKGSFNTDGPALWSTEDRITVAKKQGNGQNDYQRDERFITSGANNQTIYLDDTQLEPKYLNWLKGIDIPKNKLKKRTPMSDIIGSDLVYHARDRLNINLQTLSRENKVIFEQYLIEKNKGMGPNLIIGGSNDGLINFIIAEKGNRNTSLKAGDRYAAYFPRYFTDKLPEITQHDGSYKHLYTTNGNTNIFDAFVGQYRGDGYFKTLGLTGMGAGGKGIIGYQLYSTTTNFTGHQRDVKINFEISNKDPMFNHLGYTYSNFEFFNQVTVDGKARAVALFGNGYGSNHGSYIYKIDAMTGKRIGNAIKLPNGVGASTPSLVVQADSGGIQKLKSLYVGDYNGTLYKIDFTGTDDDLDPTINQITSYFTTVDNKPITVKPLIAKADGTQWIYFGTGAAITLEDADSKDKHYFYALKDRGTTLPSLNDMRKQQITSLSPLNNDTYYVNTSNAVSTGIGGSGWYFDINTFANDPNHQFLGERVINSPALNIQGYVSFSTWGVRKGKDGDPCDPDSTYGASITLRLNTGNSADADYIKQRSGIASKNKSYGTASGTYMDPYGPFSGGGAGVLNSYSSDVSSALIDSGVGVGSHADINDVIKVPLGNNEEGRKNQIFVPGDDGGEAIGLELTPRPLIDTEEFSMGRLYYYRR